MSNCSNHDMYESIGPLSSDEQGPLATGAPVLRP
jgi:hypothetical protein